MYPPSIEKLIEIFSRFPTVGKRTATRFVFYLLKLPKKEIEEFKTAIDEVLKKIKFCRFCFNPLEEENNLCKICKNPARDRTRLCIVEKEADLQAIENTGKYKGIYFMLGGVISSFEKEELEKLRFEELKERIKNPAKFGLIDASFKEIIIALNPTTEGETTSIYLEKILKPFKIKITRLARGLPTGGEVEYADEDTLREALERRK